MRPVTTQMGRTLPSIATFTRSFKEAQTYLSFLMIIPVLPGLLLALAGGVIGAGLAWVMFDGFSAATLNWSSFSQLTFAFYVSVPLLIQGIIFALVIGFFGGLFPAVRAARLPVADALREQ